MSYTFTTTKSATRYGKVNPDTLTVEIAACSSISVPLVGIVISSVSVFITFVAELPESEIAALETVIGQHEGEPTAEEVAKVTIDMPRTADGRLRVAAEKTAEQSRTIWSHDWTNPSTWYQQSAFHFDEIATRLSASVYRVAHSPIIDTFHGLITGEDLLLDSSNNSYRVLVFVDGVMKEEVDPHSGIGDYQIDYHGGLITFSTTLSESAQVSVTYHSAQSSLYTVRPNPGTHLAISMVEIQVSGDLELRDTVRFQVFGDASAFAPQLNLPAGTKIPLQKPSIFKTIRDYYNDSMRSYPPLPPIGGSGWRGSNQDMYCFDWDYTSERPLEATKGMELRVWLDHHTPHGGSYCTATFYGQETSD